MSLHMLTHLSNVVANGTRTSTGFKKAHLTARANAMNEHFQLSLTSVQIGNHNRTWRRKWAKIIKLKTLSGTLWDEEKSIISLDHEHYTNHIKDHEEDEPFLNKTIEHYKEMATIHGNSMATWQYAKGSNDPLATEVTTISDDEATKVNKEDVAQSQNVGESSATKPKRAKTNACGEEGLQATLMVVGERLAIAIEKDVEKDKDKDKNSAKELWDNMKELPEFGLDFLAHYYAYLIENPHIATAF
ncbi:hypothetical protein ACQ4PT_031056 [Festuca glaucescens]